MPGVINIHTGGSCPSNPGPGGYAAVLDFGNGLNATLKGSDPETTNNRMEATAAIKALELLEKTPGTEGAEIALHPNSKYLTDVFNQDRTGEWERNAFRDHGGDPVKDQDLWERLIPLARKWDVRFVWVRGQAGNHYNEICSQVAGMEAVQAVQAAAARHAGPPGEDH